MKTILLLLCVSNFAMANSSESHSKDQGRFEITANPMQSGDAFEFGYSTKSLFKLKEKSRHHWSIFGSIGTLTYSNAVIKGEAKSKELVSPELIFGIMANANFFKDYLFQYGKVALDTIFYDENLREDVGFGALLETGIEFRSDIEKLSFNLGFRWRVGLPAADQLVTEPDPFEGISIVFGSRFFF